MESLTEEIGELRKKFAEDLELASRLEKKALREAKEDEMRKQLEMLGRTLDEEMSNVREKKKKEIEVVVEELELILREEKEKKVEALEEEETAYLNEAKAKLQMKHKEKLAWMEEEMKRDVEKIKDEAKKAVKEARENVEERHGVEVAEMREHWDEQKEGVTREYQLEMENLKEGQEEDVKILQKEFAERKDRLLEEGKKAMEEVKNSQAEALALLQKQFTNKETALNEQRTALELAQKETEQALRAAQEEYGEQKASLHAEKETLQKEVDCLKQLMKQKRQELEKVTENVQEKAELADSLSQKVHLSVGMQTDNSTLEHKKVRKTTAEPVASWVEPPMSLSQAHSDISLSEKSDSNLNSLLSTTMANSSSTGDITECGTTLSESLWDEDSARRFQPKSGDPLLTSLQDINQELSGLLFGLKASQKTSYQPPPPPPPPTQQRLPFVNLTGRQRCGRQGLGFLRDEIPPPLQLEHFEDDDVSRTMSMLKSQRKWAQSIRRDLGRTRTSREEYPFGSQTAQLLKTSLRSTQKFIV
eukprot:m.233454 g.233454  ORF g.233454 m.233454 type:complete len:533 (+) comp40089_c0_seq12:1545-3143(+)